MAAICRHTVRFAEKDSRPMINGASYPTGWITRNIERPDLYTTLTLPN